MLDPFSGGGSIPLQAARLGFEAHAADSNPVDVRTVKIGGDGKFEQQFDLRENDVVLITLKPQR